MALWLTPSDPEGCMIMPYQGRNPTKVYNEIRANMDNDPLHLSPILCHSPIYGKDPHEYPNNQSPDCEDQESIFWTLWVIMRHYQTFLQLPVYDPPGKGNCAYYALAHALGLTSCDAHLKVRNDLLTELVTHRDDYLKLHSHGTKEKNSKQRWNGLNSSKHRTGCLWKPLETWWYHRATEEVVWLPDGVHCCFCLWLVLLFYLGWGSHRLLFLSSILSSTYHQNPHHRWIYERHPFCSDGSKRRSVFFFPFFSFFSSGSYGLLTFVWRFQVSYLTLLFIKLGKTMQSMLQSGWTRFSLAWVCGPTSLWQRQAQAEADRVKGERSSRIWVWGT